MPYLDWSTHLFYLKCYDPEATFNVKEYKSEKHTRMYMGNDTWTCSVHVEVQVGGNVRDLQLPVMKNTVPYSAIEMPTAREVNDSIQRCLSKCISVQFGLGYYLYMGLTKPCPLPIIGEQSLDSNTQSVSNSPFIKNTQSPGHSINRSDNSNTSTTQGTIEGSLATQTILIGFPGEESLTYEDKYGHNILAIDKQITYLKSNGHGERATKEISNLESYKAELV